MKGKNQALIYYLIFYCSLALITALFYIPTVKGYLTGKSWVSVDVRPKKKQNNIYDTTYFYNSTKTAYLSKEWTKKISFEPNSSAGIYMIIFDFINLILLFISVWYFLKIIICSKSEGKLKASTLKWIEGLGKILIIWWLLAFVHDLLMKYYLLKAVGFEGYKTYERQGAFLIVGFILIYFANVYKRGLILQQENDLTV